MRGVYAGQQGELSNITTHSLVVKSLDFCHRRLFAASDSTEHHTALTHTPMVDLMKSNLRCVRQVWRVCTSRENNPVPDNQFPCYFIVLRTHLMTDSSATFKTFPGFRVNLTFMDFHLQTRISDCYWQKIWVNIITILLYISSIFLQSPCGRR